MKKIKNFNKAFTLVETLVAISIFTMSLLGIMSVLAGSISNTSYAKQKMTASYLAQEGIEYIRNMRDTYVLYDPVNSQTGWNAFNAKLVPSPNTLCASANGCYFDDQKTNYTNHSQQTYKDNLIINACSSSTSTCPNGALLYDSLTGKYGYFVTSTTTNSGFTRKINLTQVVVGGLINEVIISSTVYWTQGSGNYSVTFSEHLFNWI